jgi:excisionase family DNA binding protein
MEMPRFSLKKTDEPARLLTVRDVAELDNVSEKTVRRAIAAGLLEVVRPGPGNRLVRIEPRALEAYRCYRGN